MLSTRPVHAHAIVGAAVASGLVLFTGGTALADHLDGPGGFGSPVPADPQLTISSPEVVEGTGGTNELVFVLELSAPASGGEGLKFFTQDAIGSADPIFDHDPVLTYVTFAAGESQQSVSVPVVTDNVPEPDEEVVVGVSNPTGLAVVDSSSTGLIIDDDPGPGDETDVVRPRPSDPPDRVAVPDGSRDPGSGGRTPEPTEDGERVLSGGLLSLQGPAGAPMGVSTEQAAEEAGVSTEGPSVVNIRMLPVVAAILGLLYLVRTRLARHL